MSSDFPTDPSAAPSESWPPGPSGQQVLVAAEASSPQRAWVLPVLLFLATAVTTTYAGLFYVRSDLGFVAMAFELAAHPAMLLKAFSFSFTLMAILLAHEMGHFLACRYYGIACTPPYFIPLPNPPAGTLGAFIRIKSPFQHKKALFDVGVAGPLAGFVFLVPALIIGIASSTLIPKTSGGHGDIYFGEPILFRLVGALVLGYHPDTQDMLASPMAMAAWFGLLATSLNLFPIWQLDGGHIAYALLGRERQKRLSIAATVLLMLVSLAGWPIPSYFLFACLVLFFGLRYRFYHPPALSEIEDVGSGRVVLGLIALLILILAFTPVPITIT